ncbi:MAG: hypothetical protein NT166_27285 [Candidatus Aminicenantes bacterium]|nr:hypothetical protein [Candidatus Aminicenantes bacterium]
MKKKLFAVFVIFSMVATIGILSLGIIGTLTPTASAFTGVQACVINCGMRAAYSSTDPDVRIILFDMCLTAECW